MSNENYNLFVYGSLRSGFRNPVYRYLTKYFHLVGEAVVKGRLYDQGEYPVAKPTEDEKFISGELYAINNSLEFSWAIGQLDDYEGLNAEAGEPVLYKREEVIAYHNGQAHTAWIYWYNGDVSGKPEIESGDLLQYLQQKNKP
jgi:gamma-glutamylcyclotransferase (GGCT)/AIG2-like uncharacterized protein YtfP